MDLNVALWDRGLRIFVGVSLLLLAIAGPRTAWGLLGVVPLITGAMGVCPLYRAFGITSFGKRYRDLHAH